MSLPGKDGSSLLASVRPYLGWTSLDAGRMARLDRILGTLDDDLFPGGIIPRLIRGEMHYYAVAASHSQRQRLSSLLRAFVGPTITDFSGQLVSFNDWDDLEALLIANGYPSGFRFTAGSDTVRGQFASQSIERLRHLVSEGGSVSANQPRTTAQELWRFELSLAAYDRTGAEEAIKFLRNNMRLDAINLGALTVRLHSRFQEWEQICQLEIFPSLCRARRAAKVTDLLAEAVYRAHVFSLENEIDPSLLLAAFEESVLPNAGNLFGSCPDYVSPVAGRAFLLAAAASDPPDDNLAERLRTISSGWLEEEGIVFEALWHHFFQESHELESEVVSAESNYHQQVEQLLLEETHPTLKRAQAGLIAATQLNTTQAFQAVVAYLEVLQSDDRDSLLSNPFNRHAYERMVEQVAGTFTPENWVEWIGVLDRDDISVPKELALSLTDQWEVGEHLRDRQRVSELVDALDSVAPAAEDRLLDILPLLVQWLQSDQGWPNFLLLPLYRTIYDRVLLQLSERWWREAAGVAKELLQAMLELGTERNEYAQLLNDLRDVLPTAPGRSDAAFLLDLAEVIVDNSSPALDSRLGLWVSIVGGLKSVESLLSVEDAALINDVGEVLGVAPVFQVAPETMQATADSSTLAGKTVAVYSLAESVAQRVSRLLQKLHPGVGVVLASDTVANRSLEELARRADIFVVCWRSATHAATEIIKRNRPVGSPPIYPDGKGSSSILRVLQESLLS